MITDEIVQRSPVRIFEKSIQGGLRSGEIGIIASSSGIGKTSVLVQLALDKLLQGKKVIHVSFTQHTDYVISWYENIFEELFKKRNTVDIKDLRGKLVKNRVLMNFNQEGVTSEQINRSLRAMIIEGGFKAESIIVDGLDFSHADRARFVETRDFAAGLGLSVWYSCNLQGREPQYDKQRLPLIVKDYVDLLDVVITLEPKPDHIALMVSKDHDVYNPQAPALRLDHRTLLILEG
ncbi:MAG: hypothetical protein LBJ41_01270 [Treponema sp.]|jgi:hypothetical protein|nr:hypothetical protein [Treponema sp.]